jgi:hypothetical protein
LIPKPGHRWRVSEKRLQVLLGQNPKKKVFVKRVEEETKYKESI